VAISHRLLNLPDANQQAANGSRRDRGMTSPTTSQITGTTVIDKLVPSGNVSVSPPASVPMKYAT
jgi:hypothetical protein